MAAKTAPARLREQVTGDPGADLRSGRKLADAIRSRMDKVSNDRELNIIPGSDIRHELTRASFAPDSALGRADLGSVAGRERAPVQPGVGPPRSRPGARCRQRRSRSRR